MKVVVDDFHLVLRDPVDSGYRIQTEAKTVEDFGGRHDLGGRNGGVKMVTLEVGIDGIHRHRPGGRSHLGWDRAGQAGERLGELLDGRLHSFSLATGKRRLPVSFSSSLRMPSISASGRGGQPGT